MPIKSVSDQRRLQIIAKVRTGKKVPTRSGKERPMETSHFVLDPTERTNGKPNGKQNPHILKLIEEFGPEPTELPIILPLGERLPDGDYLVAQQALRWYAKDKKGVSRVMCKGDNEWADYKGISPVDGVNTPGIVYPDGYNRSCSMETCPQFKEKKCKPTMKFIFWIDGYPISAGLFSIDTSSVTAMIGLNSTLEMAERTYMYELLKSGVIQSPEQFPGLAGVPLRLFRKEVPNREGGVNYPLQIEVDVAKLTLGIKQLSAGEGGLILPIGPVEMTKLLEGPAGTEFDDNIIDPNGEADVIDTETGEVLGTSAQVLEKERTANPEGVDLKGDPEIGALFAELCQLTNRKDTPKIRALTAKKFENEANQREALVAYLKNALVAEKNKQAASQTSDTQVVDANRNTAQESATEAESTVKDEAPQSTVDAESGNHGLV